jgi:choline kinase
MLAARVFVHPSMNGKPEIAVILAAGRGQRMKQIGLARPKGFLRIGELPIVEESVLRLRAAGLHEVVIVTGHLAEYYVKLASRYPSTITLVHNPAFASTGSMHSLLLAQPHVRGDFLLLDSDLIYENRALAELLVEPAPNALLVSGATGSGDEVYVEARNRLLCNLSKERVRLGGEIVGEMVGISKISSGCYEEIIDYARHRVAQPAQLNYENALATAAARVPVYCRVVADLLWSDIDNEDQLERVTKSTYPAIVVRDGPLKHSPKQ